MKFSQVKIDLEMLDVGSIIEDEPYYMLFEYFEGNWDKEEIYDDIDAGWYSLNGNTIKKIKDSDIINE